MRFHEFRHGKHEAHTRLVLRYLSHHGYTTPALLQDYLGLKNSRSVAGKLKTWMNKELVERFTYHNPLGGRANYLYRLTPNGIAHARLYGTSPRAEVKVSESNLSHQIMMQQVYVALKKRRYFGFATDKGIDQALDRFGHYPDFLCTNARGQRVVIECERTIKSKSRYCQLLADYHHAREHDHLQGVIYVTPDERIQRSLEATMQSAIAKPFERKGLRFALDFEQMSTYLRIVTLAQLLEEGGSCFDFRGFTQEGTEYSYLLHYGCIGDSTPAVLVEPLDVPSCASEVIASYASSLIPAAISKAYLYRVSLYQAGPLFTTLDGEAIDDQRAQSLALFLQ